MTDNTENKTTGKAPTHIAYHVRNGKDKGFFTRIGAAWPLKNGNGFNIQLDVVPLSGRVTLLVASEDKGSN